MQIGDTITPEISERVYVYCLFETDTQEFRYIGKTGDPLMRYRAHSGSREGYRTKKIAQWFDEVRARGADVHMQIIAVCNSDKEACDLEWHYIKGLSPGGRLLNAPHVPNYSPRGKRSEHVKKPRVYYRKPKVLPPLEPVPEGPFTSDQPGFWGEARTSLLHKP